VPHEWSTDDVSVVADLAAMVVTEIELRHDIIARQHTEAALYESNVRFTSAFHHASIGMALVALDGRWLQVNPALCELLGYTEQQLLATTFQALTHPNDLDIDLAYVQQMLRDEITTYQMEKRYIHKNGAILWMYSTCRWYAMCMISRNISSRRFRISPSANSMNGSDNT